MCLIAFQFQDHPKFKLILAANRDEFYGRPAAAADFWEDYPNILAGRDLQGMGTWLGVTTDGRIAALTNYRSPDHMNAGELTRGAIVRDFLADDTSPESFAESLNRDDYAGFNLLFGTPDELFYFNNLENKLSGIAPGTHGLSNHFLNTPWPKVEKSKRLMQAYCEKNASVQVEELFTILADAEQAEDAQLPDTGVGTELERVLSSMFIRTPDYGTRCSTVLLIGHDNSAHFAERRYENGKPAGDRQFAFTIQPA